MGILLTSLLEMPDSNVGLKYSNWVFLCFLQSQCQHNILIGHDRFIPHTFRFIFHFIQTFDFTWSELLTASLNKQQNINDKDQCSTLDTFFGITNLRTCRNKH
jgi:hypothetical protein